MLILQIYHLLAFSIRCSIEKVLLIRKDSGEGFTDKSGDSSETDIRGWGTELAWDTEVRLSTGARCPLSGGIRIPITYTDKKLQNRRFH
jgi:hypothetical protein